MPKGKKLANKVGINPDPSFVEKHTPAFLGLLAFLMNTSKTIQNVVIPYVLHIGVAFNDIPIDIKPIYT